MKTHPFTILKQAGWKPQVSTGGPRDSRKAWPRDQTLILHKGESSVVCSPTDQMATFRICKRGHCEDFMVAYDDEKSLQKFAKTL